MKKSPAKPTITKHFSHPRAFTLMETVIAIGVLALLLTGFLAVFTPATLGIRRSLNTQVANRLTSTLEQELVTLRVGQEPVAAKTGFDKAFEWLRTSNEAATAIFVYQYRGDSASIRADGTPTPLNNVTGQPGSGYIVQSICRRANDPLLEEDLEAIDGPIFYVKATQLVYSGNEMVLGTVGTIANPKDTAQIALTADDYPDAVIAFAAEFHSSPTNSFTYLSGPNFATRFANSQKPVFIRNLAIRR